MCGAGHDRFDLLPRNIGMLALPFHTSVTARQKLAGSYFRVNNGIQFI